MKDNNINPYSWGQYRNGLYDLESYNHPFWDPKPKKEYDYNAITDRIVIIFQLLTGIGLLVICYSLYIINKYAI